MNLTYRILLKLVQQVLGCKVNWTEEQLKLMEVYLGKKAE